MDSGKAKEHNNLVLILKSPSDDDVQDPYVEALHKSGVQVKFVPTLQFQYKNLEILRSRLQQPENYSGIIFSSTRCVQSVILSLKTNSEQLNEDWKKRKCFVVGEITASLIGDSLKLPCEGTSSGNLSNLLREISHYEFNKPLLMPVGNLHKSNKEYDNFKVEEVEVYDTVEHSEMKNSIRKVFESSSPTCVVFFSPSGVKSALPMILQVCSESIQFIAIGPTTAKELECNRVKVSGVCERPSPDNLVNTVSTVIKER